MWVGLCKGCEGVCVVSMKSFLSLWLNQLEMPDLTAVSSSPGLFVTLDKSPSPGLVM
jgi:hypothetical protein